MTGPLELCDGAVLVYFEGCAATHVATFADDELYGRCVRALEAAAIDDYSMRLGEQVARHGAWPKSITLPAPMSAVEI